MTKALGRHWLTATVLLVGIGLTVTVSWWSEVSVRERAGLLMDRRARLVAQSMAGAVGDTLKDAAAAAGLFEASEEVTEDEWHRFVEKIGHHPGSLGLAYLPVVPAQELSAHLTEVRRSHPSYRLFWLDPSGDPVRPGARDPYHPVRYFAFPPGSALDLRGLAAGNDPAWAEALERAGAEGRPILSALGHLPPDPSQVGYLAVAPIEEGDQRGFTAVVVRLDRLVEAELAGSLLPLVTWNVTDVTRPVSAPASPDPLVRVEEIAVGGRTWRLEVRPTEEARADLASSPVRAGVTLGVLLSVLAALVAHLGAHAFRGAREAAELRRLTGEKDEFLAAVSHELRTPLTVVVGMAEILGETLGDADPDVAEYVGLLRSESGELARLVEDLLLMGRLQTETLPMEPAPVDVRWEAERILTELDPPEGTSVLLEGGGEAWADPLRLRQILRNLLGNALRHGGKQVGVGIEETSSEVRVMVSDDGPGVPDAHVPYLFSASLGTKVTAGGPSSLGLGLRISARLALALGGGLDYRRRDGWTIFEVRLPRAKGRGTQRETASDDAVAAEAPDRADTRA